MNLENEKKSKKKIKAIFKKKKKLPPQDNDIAKSKTNKKDILWEIYFILYLFLFFFPLHPTGRADKLDNSFSRSRSSSMSSLENISSEAVTCLAFVDSYTKKSGKFWC